MKFIYNNNDQIRLKLKGLLAETGTKQKDIAPKIGMSPQELTNMLRKKSIRFEDVNKILSAVGYSLNISFEPND